jgi:ABC-2 type transport system ATP-binding protein
LLRTENLAKRFRGVDALHGVTLDVPEGAVFALVGPNGAGKSTLIKVVMNILEPTSGRAEVLGIDSRRLGAAQLERIGYVSENQQLPDWMTVRYFLDYCKAFYPGWQDEDLDSLVHLYELPLDRPLGKLSRGMRVKAALAASLAYRPGLIILDEPFSGLDVLVREQLIESILERTPEATVFLASHDLAEIESFASHVGYLNEGRLEFVEEMAALSRRFREIEVTLEAPVVVPARLPDGWLGAESAGVVMRFVDSRYDAENSESEIRARFSGVRDIAARSMSLRSMFLALARSHRQAKGAA